MAHNITGSYKKNPIKSPNPVTIAPGVFNTSPTLWKLRPDPVGDATPPTEVETKFTLPGLATLPEAGVAADPPVPFVTVNQFAANTCNPAALMLATVSNGILVCPTVARAVRAA